MNDIDTIAAIATAAGQGGVGMVRISGPQAHRIAQALTRQQPRPRHAHYARFFDADGSVIDSGLLLAFEAPKTYTGEAVVELNAHGSPPILAALLRRVMALGARQARPGEFTERAFLNGKLDLAQAEAVADLIAAGSDAAARAATRSLDGVFSRQVESVRERLVRLRVHVEAAIDFPEEEIDFLGDGQIAVALAAVRSQHADLMRAAQRGQRLRDGLHVVILGPPNAGKSSLLNALAGDERAIVTPIAGTTRDVLRETIRLDGIELSLVDTAGLREDSEDLVEREGIRRAGVERDKADLILAVTEAGDDSARARLRDDLQARGKPILWLHNKIDAAQQNPRSEMHEDGQHLWLSARSGQGLPLLINALKTAAGLQGEQSGAFTARARHVAILEQVGELLDQSVEQLTIGAGELLAEDLRLAHEQLGEITGQVRSDDLLGEIFSSFCIGK